MLVINHQQVKSILTPKLAIAAVETALTYERQRRTVLPARLNVEFDKGWLRLMPGVIKGDDDWGVMGCKIMNLNKERGLHYLILLYALDTGELLAMIDGAAITQIRTGAVSAVVAKKLAKGPVSSVAVIGTGYEARGQLAALHSTFPLERAVVYSRSEQNRNHYANEMSRQLGMDIQTAQTAEEAVKDQKLIVMATKSSRPVIDGSSIQKNSVILSIGSTRLDLRELDSKTLIRTAWMIVDQKEQVLHESADIQEGLRSHLLNEDQFKEIHELGEEELDTDDHKDLLVFKSSGTALQDLSAALEVYKVAVAEELGECVDSFPYLKEFNHR